MTTGSNVLPGEGSDTDYPILRLAIDIALGAEIKSDGHLL